MKDFGAEPTDEAMRIPELPVVSFEHDTDSMSLWDFLGDASLKSNQVAPGGQSIYLNCNPEGKTAAIRQYSIKGKFKKDTLVNLSFRSDLLSKNGASVQIQIRTTCRHLQAG